MMRRLPIWATLVVALASGVLAAVATHDVALRTGAVTNPNLAWLLPAIVEGGALTAALLAWSRTEAGRSARCERVAMLMLMGLATWVNASHVTTGQALGIVLAAAPPLILVGSVELLLLSTRGERSETVVGDTITAPARVSLEHPERSAPSAAPKRVSAQVVEKVSTEREHVERTVTDRERVTVTRAASGDTAESVARLLAEQPDIKAPAVAQALALGQSTARRHLAAARERMAA